MKRCELCSHLARMYCQSDNASLCYDCDQTVHSANFLVTKHSRTLLCHKCQSPTPWTASGLNLGHAASACVKCLDQNSSRRTVLMEGESSVRENEVAEENCGVDYEEAEDGETDDDDSEFSDESGNDDEDGDEDEDEDEDAENQVVPWSFVASPPATGVSSSIEEFSSSRISSDGFRSVTKRERLDAYIDSEEDSLCSSERSNCKRRTEIDDVISVRSFRPLKLIRSDRVGDHGEA